MISTLLESCNQLSIQNQIFQSIVENVWFQKLMQEGTGTHGLKRIYIEFVISDITTNKKAMFYK